MTPLVLLALQTGLRRGELFAPRWRDVDLREARLTVPGEASKTGETRHVPLNNEAVTVLKAWRPKDALAEHYIFPGDEPTTALVDVKTAWGELVKAAKLSAFRFHDLRHTFASKLVQRGVDLAVVRELLGHKAFAMTLRYSHLADEQTRAAVAELAEAWTR